MTCAICGGRGYTTRDHAYWQDGATQYETIEDECPCVSAPDGPSYDDLDAEPATAVGVLAVDGLVPDARALDGDDLSEAEQCAHFLAGQYRALRLRSRVAPRGLWR